MAIASILHRISGLVLFLLMPAMIYFLDISLRNAGTFATLQTWLARPLCKLMLWAFLASLIFHLLAGIRHMVMDMGFGESLNAGRLSSIGVILASAVLTILVGIWLW